MFMLKLSMPKQKPEKRSHVEAFGATEAASAVQDPDDGDQPVSTDHPTLILHIGSSTLTFGFATDPTPQSLPHVIAYSGSSLTPSSSDGDSNNDRGGDPKACDVKTRDETLVLEYPWNVTPALEAKREESIVAITDTLQALRQASGVRNCEVNTEEYMAYNSRVRPVARDSEELALTDVSGSPQFVIGNEVLYLPPNSGYTVFKPLRSGRLNCYPDRHHEVASSLHNQKASRSAVLGMLEDLWTKAIEDYLQIERKNFKGHRVVLLVPDTTDRTLLKEFMNILLLRMDFAAAFVHQESVCAAYCAGLSTCCVVNVGDEVTHISCIEEGMSSSNMRVAMNYGGSDITRLFYRLVRKTNFPYDKCSPDNRLDGVLIQQLKESVCHLDSTIWGVRDYQFSVMSPTPGLLLDYEIKLSDEGIIAAMGVYFPAVFSLPSDTQLMRGQVTQGPDMGDIFDESHWAPDVLSSQQKKVKTEPSGLSMDEQLQGLFVSGDLKSNEHGVAEVTRRLRKVECGGVLPLDRAVLFSIDCAASQELKSKLYSNILLIGGGLSFPSSSKMLQSRLESQFPAQFAGNGDNIEVISNVRELDSTHVCWKGGSVLSCLDTCHELWVEKQEWEFSGVRLLRERAPFLW